MRTGRRIALFLSVLAGVMVHLATATVAAAKDGLQGVALVIGQSSYEHIPGLPNPANDAREMVKLLTDLGFDANSVTDRDSRRLQRDLERFVEDAAEADVALLYYAGHGIEAGGENWLVPIDADHASLDSASETLVGLSAIIDELKRTVPVTIVLLDACRTNPFPVGSMVRAAPDQPAVAMSLSGLSPVRGATPLNASTTPANDNLGVVISFAAEPGLPALDGAPGQNSPYATAILRHLAAMQGVEFGSVMRMVTEEVYLATGTRQRPWVNESLRRQLFFGIAPQEPEGDEALITGERRQLLLTIAELPDLSRVQVEQVASRDGVPLDALYGILRALDETAQPKDSEDLTRMLDQQAERLQKMLSERASLSTEDPEIARLSDAADRAIAEGAIQTARLFMDQAVARVEETAPDVDELENLIRQKRIADAAIYAKRADALTLAFEFRAAAADYGKAYDLIGKWDETLAWNYKNLQAETLRAHGEATGERAALDEALQAYEEILRSIDDREGRDWAITRNNMGVVLHAIGEASDTGDELQRALAIFEESMAVFDRLGDSANWSAAQNNIGNILLLLGGRESSLDRLHQSVEAFKATLARRDRALVPMDWASTQNNIGLVSHMIAERGDDPAAFDEAEAAYRAALEVFTRQTSPVDWGMVLNNLGNTQNARGLRLNARAMNELAVETFTAALEVRNRETWPQQWAATQVNLGAAYNHIARHEMGTDALEKAQAAFENALEVFDREQTPLDWASAQNNLGATLQTLGQRAGDVPLLDASLVALGNAREVYRRSSFPLDWAMTHQNEGNTLLLKGALTSDNSEYRAAIISFKRALSEFERDTMPMQWAMTTNSLASALQSMAATEATTARLKEAITARRAALEMITIDNAPVEWANAQNGLGTCLLNLSTREQSTAPLDEARSAFEAARQVFTREEQLVQWSFIENNIGDVHWNLAAQGGGDDEYRRAIESFESAKQGFGEAGLFGAVMLAERKIGLIRDSLAEN